MFYVCSSGVWKGKGGGRLLWLMKLQNALSLEILQAEGQAGYLLYIIQENNFREHC